MKHSTWLGLILAALSVPALADVVGFECSGPGGPYNGNPDYGLNTVELISDNGYGVNIGVVDVYNTREELKFIFKPNSDIKLTDIQLWTNHDILTIPTKKDGKPHFGKFPYVVGPKLAEGEGYEIVLSLEELEFTWGGTSHKWWFLIHGDYAGGDFIAKGPCELNDYEKYTFNPKWIHHPARAHFRDSPVVGLGVNSPTYHGKTETGGAFDYFPGESAEFKIGDFTIGHALADHVVTPLDFFDSSDSSDPRVINMARLLQSLDSEASPKDGISITTDVESCFNLAMMDLGLTGIDFSDDAQTESIIEETITECTGVVDLVSVSAEDAKINLDKSLDSTMFRKNVSKTPELTSSKSKLNIMGVWFPALRANGEPATYLDGETVVPGVPYYDENGDLIRVATEAKPIVLTYTDGVEETGYEDIFAAVSRDDGHTFKRKNLSRAADRSSFILENGTEYYGQAKKPVFQVKGNNILVAWTSKFCKGGKPTFAIKTCDDPLTSIVETPETGCAEYCTGKEEDGTLQCEEDYPYDDLYYVDDIWGVGGPQRSVDYAEQDYPEVGEVPYSCVWAARGTILTAEMLNKDPWNATNEEDEVYAEGDIVWFKPERLTSGRRDANQVFMGGADGAGFAIAWQEDPEGLRPGDAAGPGPGWGGATTNHKTDIWYSYITKSNFAKVDTNFVSGGDPEHDLDVIGRPKALVPMSLPVRISDNDTVNTDNLMVELGEDGYPEEDGNGDWIPITNLDATSDDADGTHAYGYRVDGLCDDFYEFINNQDVTKRVCITEDGRLLDGDTGASRPNLFLQTYTKSDGSKSAWAIMAYEETKGAGIGPPDHEEDSGPYGDEPVPEEGKNAIYLSFDFQKPPEVVAGNIINLPERDADGNLVYLREVSVDADGNVVYGDLILDHLGLPILAYENARRPRFILQGKSAAITPPATSRTVLLVLYKEGIEGHGRPSDILMRRIVAPEKGNPYAFKNMLCEATAIADNGLKVCVDGTWNMSSVTPTETIESQGDPDKDDAYGALKVVKWEQTLDNFDDATWTNPYDDARAHRGQIRGDLVTMGYSYTPNWAAARNGNDKYDFYVRRSFDGGLTWTTDPDGEGVEHLQIWTDYSDVDLTAPDAEDPDAGGKPKIEEYTFYGPGEFESTRNLSQLKNAKSSVIEPRIVCPPGTIKIDGAWTGIAEDKQNKNVCYVAFGTSTNPKKDPETGEQEAPVPMDLWYSYTQDKGETFIDIAWEVNPDSSGTNPGETIYRWDFMAKGDPEQGEVQLRMTPDGSRFYASWLDEGEEGSDIMFRRIMPNTFPANVVPETP